MLGDRNKEEIVGKQKVLPERLWTEDRWMWGWGRKGREVNESIARDLEEGFCNPCPSPRMFFTASLAEIHFCSC